MLVVFRKLGIALLVFWLLCAALAWLWPAQENALVGARSQAPSAVPEARISPVLIADALLVLEKTPLWGVQRDGQPFPPVVPPSKAEEAKVVWNVIATVVQKDQRFVLLQIDKEVPRPLKEGELFPDGSKLIKVLPNAWTVEAVEAEHKTVTSHFIASENDAHRKKNSLRR